MQHNLQNIIKKQLKSNVISVFTDQYSVESKTHLVVYRQNLQLISMYFKLNSVFNLNSIIDAFSVDCIENNFRFTVFYQIQSYINNTQVSLITKTKDSLSLFSLSNIFPALN
jgi:NADH:ubiquinone oxidoreductase subunit C